MKRYAAVFCAAALLTLPAAALSADDQPIKGLPKKEGKVVTETLTVENAVVKAIDRDTRTVTLVMSDGREKSVVVDKAVKKLDQVEVGDTVKVLYYEAVSTRINKTKVQPGIRMETMVGREEKTVKPAGTASVQVTAVATIDKIMDDGNMVTLRMPDGLPVDVRVRDPENRAKLRSGEVTVGDQVEITYTKALAISVEKVVRK
jgi:hypothetical protein